MTADNDTRHMTSFYNETLLSLPSVFQPQLPVHLQEGTLMTKASLLADFSYAIFVMHPKCFGTH
jgi:hypothetical protein